MPRLRDATMIIRPIGPWTFVRRLFQQISEDNVFTWGAAMAYSWLFAVFPFLVFLLSLVPFLPERLKPDVKQNVAQVLNQTLPQDAASIVMKQVENVLAKPSAGGFLSFGLVLTIWAASGGMSITMSALDQAYDVTKLRPYYIQRPLAVLLTLIVATLMILVMVLLPVGTGVLHWLMKQGEILWWVRYLVDIIRYSIALLLMFTILAIIYHFGRSDRGKFHSVTPGALFCIVVWLMLGWGFKMYLTQFGGEESYNKTYGAVAGAVMLLLMFYLDSLVLLIGAEINSELDAAARSEA